MVLNRHDIDLTRIDYSCIGGTVYLSGELLKTFEEDLAPAMVESLFKEIARVLGVRNVQSDLLNWNICTEAGSWQITKGKKKLRDIGVPLGGAAEASKDVHIDTNEEIADVLKDIQGKPEQEDQL